MENWSSLERVVGSTKQQRRGGLANLEVRIEAFFFFLIRNFLSVGLLFWKEYLSARGGCKYIWLDKEQVLERAFSSETSTLNSSSSIILPRLLCDNTEVNLVGSQVLYL